MLATVTPAGAVHLVGGVAIGLFILTHLEISPGENLDSRIGRRRRSVGVFLLEGVVLGVHSLLDHYS